VFQTIYLVFNFPFFHLFGIHLLARFKEKKNIPKSSSSKISLGLAGAEKGLSFAVEEPCQKPLQRLDAAEPAA
jgi:hypothetical protein